MAPSTLLPLATLGDVGEARRAAAALGAEVGLDEAARSDLGIVVTEAATNVVRHGRGGKVVLRPLGQDGARGVEVLCVDVGPGMANVAECMRDGHSSAGSMGTGLGAISRLAEGLDIYSVPGRGTLLVARVRARRAPRAAAPAPPATVAVCLPMPGEQECGDNWSVVEAGSRTTVLVVDGLGHGPAAAEAGRTAVELFERVAPRAPSEILETLHRGMRGTRGAAAAVAEIDAAARTVRFGGIGNIGAAIVTGAGIRRLVSRSGTLGHQVRRIQQFDYPWPPDGTLVLHSDGLGTHWHADAYPGLLRRDPALLCGALYRDFARGRDDVTVIAHRAAPP
jgi:anti-sigma regulatory factor (Ser/Thr protein kinase)